MPIRRDAVCTAFLRVLQGILYPKLPVTAFNADIRPMGSVHSKNGAVNEEDKKALRRENYKASTTSSDRNSHQARAEDVLSTLEQAALLAHVPNLRKAASLAISLLDVIPVSEAPTSISYVSPNLVSTRVSM